MKPPIRLITAFVSPDGTRIAWVTTRAGCASGGIGPARTMSVRRCTSLAATMR
ncbi:MAG: PD40 domain-containing protein [Phycisphaerae bacterium]|nr:PD40 domain-containing protein [Phycisphaerae bacterium]